MLKRNRKIRKTRVRGKIAGTETRPRLSIFRSNKFIYGQVINDEKSHTMVAASGADSKEVGSRLAQRLIKKKIKNVVFDRSGYKYHGRAKALADAVRAGGVKL